MVNNPVGSNHEKLFLDLFSDKSNFDYNPEFTKIIQTHISIICIAPPYVFKVKKDIKLDFLDYSTPAKRKKFILKELTLNQRLCEGIYLGIIPVYLNNGKLTFSENQDIYDYALKMKFMPDDKNLMYLLKSDKLSKSSLNGIVSYLYKFYKSQKPLHDKEKILVNKQLAVIRENLKEIINQFSSDFSHASLSAVAYYTKTYIKNNLNLFKTRFFEGFVKDCHGDLRIEHIYVLDNKICIYDCIEFNDSFRQIDILCDLAFLGMEFDYYGFHETGTTLINKIIHKNNDNENSSLIIFYKIYRATVRTKVNAILSMEKEINKPARQKAMEQAVKFLSLSLKYSLSGDQPLVIVVMGKTASGKSTISGLISKDLGCQRISTDEIRKQMANIDIWSRTPENLKSSIYSSDFSRKVYSNLLLTASNELKKQNIVVIDGTYSKQIYRRQLLKKFSKYRVYFIELTASSKIAEDRLKQREFQKSVSDARLMDKSKIDSLYENPLELSSDQKIFVKNDRKPESVVAEIYKKLVFINMFK